MPNLILLTSLFSLGLFVTGQEGYILYPIRKFIAHSLGGFLKMQEDEWFYEFSGSWEGNLFKPFWGCPTCMASVWGCVIYLLFENVTRATIHELPVLIICSAGLNFIIFNNMIKKWL